MSLAERFWSKVDRRSDDECWEWQGARKSGGYGVMRPEGQRNGPTVKAHRMSLMLAGVDVEGVVVRHRCDNPPCVNPAHLEVGTKAENSRDMVDRGRFTRPNARLTEEQAAQIKALLGFAGLTHKVIASHYGVTRGAVTAIATGRSWAVTPPAARDLVGAVAESLTLDP